jgi:ferritin
MEGIEGRIMNEKILKVINEQVNAELYSAYLYISMEAYFHSINLKGFANWTRVQALEEQIHAGKFFDYLAARGGKISLKEIQKPPSEWKSPLDVFQAIYAHEQKVTGMINNLVDIALSEKDHATYNILQFFVAEQVEEESSADAIIQKLKLVGNEGNGLFMIDQELAQRVFVMPPAPV